MKHGGEPASQRPDYSVLWSRNMHFGLRTIFVAIAIVAAGLAAWKRWPVSAGTRPTGRDLDVAIFGRGYFEVISHTGELFYTRRGDFGIDRNGQLTLGGEADLLKVSPSVTVPPDWTHIRIDANGDVSVAQSGATGWTQVGALMLVNFINPDGLNEVLPDVYAETAASGTPFVGAPGVSGLGRLKQGWLETTASERIAEWPVESLTLVALGIALAWCVFELREQRRLLNRLAASAAGSSHVATSSSARSETRFDANEVPRETRPAELVAVGYTGEAGGPV